MHGTGTSLGDPIEVGAVAAVFGQRSAPSTASTAASPLALITSKSSLGHAEPAAGIVGMLHSLNAVQQGALPPLTHLRVLNPFVASALGGSRGDGQFFLPRQMAPRGAVCAGQGLGLVAGVSSFAFQVCSLVQLALSCSFVATAFDICFARGCCGVWMAQDA
jgi:acyl transferase domain-containing protein